MLKSMYLVFFFLPLFRIRKSRSSFCIYIHIIRLYERIDVIDDSHHLRSNFLHYLCSKCRAVCCHTIVSFRFKRLKTICDSYLSFRNLIIVSWLTNCRQDCCKAKWIWLSTSRVNKTCWITASKSNIWV